MATLQEKYDAGKKAYAASLRKNRGQAGGSGSVSSSGKKSAFRELQRQKFFGDRKDIPTERIDRRTRQEGALRQFKDSLIRNDRVLKDSSGNTVYNANTGEPVFLTDVPGGKSVSDVSQDLAQRFGPTGKEILGDIGYGLSSMGKAFGIPFVSNALRIGQAVKSGVEAAWDAVRGEPTTIEGTNFPQPSSDTKDLFSSIDTGIAQVDPDNMLVQIAKANEGRFDDAPSFQDQLANATAMNLNIPSPTDVAKTISDYYTAAAQGVNVDTPIGNVNVNPLAQKLFLDGGIGDIRYGGSLDPNTLDYNVGVGTQLPYGVNFSAGASSSDIPGMSFSKNIGPVNTSFNLSEQGGSLGLNTVVDPLRALFPGSSIGTPINIGASVDSRGNINPNVGFMVPFNSGGLGYMFK